MPEMEMCKIHPVQVLIRINSSKQVFQYHRNESNCNNNVLFQKNSSNFSAIKFVEHLLVAKHAVGMANIMDFRAYAWEVTLSFGGRKVKTDLNKSEHVAKWWGLYWHPMTEVAGNYLCNRNWFFRLFCKMNFLPWVHKVTSLWYI